MYSILFFVATVAVILGARKLVANLDKFESKAIKNRWIWGIACSVSLAIGVLVIPAHLSLLKVPFIVFAIFGAMVFFEMSRNFIEKAMAVHNGK
ncbi:MAG: hypothetical protein LBV67_04740 [Streptococcaceae bacterium]|jgi:hypothetical protein|nr:hypothetical protein [Streptococcaceae bacterium]